MMMFGRFCPFFFFIFFGLLQSSIKASEWVPEERPDVSVDAAKVDDLQPSDEAFKPLWEVGLAGGVGWSPDYPAAGQNHVRGLALPFAIYRGEFFQAGERSIARGLFVNTDKVEFDLSFAGTFPADSSDNDAREGMDDLDWLGEVGPSFSYYLDRDEAGNHSRIDVALRAVLSTDFSSDFDYVGLVFHPYYAQEFVDLNGIEGLEASWSIGARWADNGVMDLFYEVPIEDANANRDAFDAEGGYLGSNVYNSFGYRFNKNFRLAVGFNIASYHGATNRESDLFIDDINFAVGLGAIWTLWTSETRSKMRQ